MKCLYFFASLLIFTSCAMSDLETSALITEEQTEGKIFHATIDNDESTTRVYIDENIHILWNAKDKITLFEGTTRNKQYQFMGEDGDNAGEFEFVKAGFGTGNDLDQYFALYPYSSTTKYVYGEDEGVEDYIRYTMPDEQTYKESSIGENANVMVAVTADLDDFDLRFRNVCSYMRVKLYGADQTVGSVVFQGNNNEKIAGNFAITPVYGSTPQMRVMGTGTSITLNCKDGVKIGSSKENATEFWLVVPPIICSKGYKVTVNGFYGGSQTFEITSSRNFERNKYNTLTRELSITNNGSGMGVGGWGNGESVEGEI